MKSHTTFKSVCSFLLAGFLTACGGGGGGGGTSGDLPPPRPTGDIVGTAFDGLVIDGVVRVNDWSAATTGAQLATTKTDGNGAYGVDVQTPDKSVRVTIDDGFYVEEATGVKIQVDRAKGYKLTAVQYYVSGTPVTVSATFFTTIADGLAEYLVKKQGMAVQSAILTANQRVSQWAGFNIQTVTPLDVTDPTNVTPAISNGHKYGYVAAGISEFTRQIHVAAGQPEHSTWPSIAFIQLAYDDIRADGKLDGFGVGGALNLGNTAITAATYRVDLPRTIMQFAVGNRNATTLDFTAVLPFATTLNTHTGSIFGNVPPSKNINDSKPTIEDITPANAATISGMYNANATVKDDLGIESIEYSINGNAVAYDGDPADPARTLNTYNLKNGTHTVTIKVTNILGNVAEKTVTVTVANGLPSVSRATISYLPVTGWVPGGCNWNFDVTDGTGLTGLSSAVLTSSVLGTMELGKWLTPAVSDATVQTGLLPINGFGDVAVTVTVTAFNGNVFRRNYVIAQTVSPPTNGGNRVTCKLQ